MAPPKIAITGAGPAGLTLARLLQVKDIQCDVFELDVDRHQRTQGGSLDLHEGSAQVALREAGLLDEFMAVARPEGEVLKIYEPDGTLLLDENKGHGESRPDSFKGRPEVDRVQLRDMLVDSLHRSTIRWGHKLQSITASETASTGVTYDLHFSNGNVETGYNLVIGADGAWSKVRPMLTDIKPLFSGINGMEVKYSNIDTAAPLLSERVGLGMCLTLGPNITVLSQRNGDGSVRSYGFMRQTEDWARSSGIDWTEPEGAKRTFIQMYYDSFDQNAKDLILHADNDSVAARPIYMLPVGHKWPHRAGCTLIGDAAHLMAPFAGVGVNVAMEDALELARVIVSCRDICAVTDVSTHASQLSHAVRTYEEAMFVRAESYAKETMMYLDLFFHDTGGRAMCEHFAKAKSQN